MKGVLMHNPVHDRVYIDMHTLANNRSWKLINYSVYYHITSRVCNRSARRIQDLVWDLIWDVVS